MKVGDLVELVVKQYDIFDTKKNREIGIVCYTGSDRKGHWISVYYATSDSWRWHKGNELEILQRADIL